MGTGAGQEHTTTRSMRLHSSTASVTQAVPGLVMSFAGGRSVLRTFPVGLAPRELGRADLADGGRIDPMISRRHLCVAFDGTDFLVTDLNSHNGSFVAGQRIGRETRVPAGRTIRAGGVLLLTVPDVSCFERYGLGVEQGVVGGPAFRRAIETISQTQLLGLVPSLLICGETGAGKEVGAQLFHRATGRSKAAFVGVNCATIPKDLAERLLFGSRRGAYSGATDAAGYVQAARGGTLFLDELAELPLDVQSKLLRMLETREVQALGATSWEPVDVRICAATWRNLREEVAAGRFREDLYFRIGQPEVRLPPLRERLEEVPWHVQHVLQACASEHGFQVSAGFLEACCLRRWPGNVRELRAEVRRALAAAMAQGSSSLNAEDLLPDAGQPIASAGAPTSPPFPADEFAAALSAMRGNVLAAARQLGVHRNRVRRWLERHGVDASAFRG